MDRKEQQKINRVLEGCSLEMSFLIEAFNSISIFILDVRGRLKSHGEAPLASRVSIR